MAPVRRECRVQINTAPFLAPKVFHATPSCLFWLFSAMSRLTPFEVGQIKAHLHHDLGAAAISKLVTKTDGQQVSVQAVVDVAAKLKANPAWRGERAEGSGRPRLTTKKEDRSIEREVLKNRGVDKVTVAFLQKRIPSLRKASPQLIKDRLHEVGFSYLRRRRKTLVPKKYKSPRENFARKVLQMHASTLERWAYSDGTVFYLERTEEEKESTERAALGPFVWRRSDRSDALYADTVGPSGYAKGQGSPVKVWGVLAKGELHVSVLPAKQNMNRWRYAKIIRDHFHGWLSGCDLIVQDFERCLRCEEPLAELRNQGLQLVKDYPKCSQDLNAIENAWKLLRERLYETMPAQLESRKAFVSRLRNAVRWINSNRQDALWEFCANQKKRARDVLSLMGGRAKW